MLGGGRTSHAFSSPTVAVPSVIVMKGKGLGKSEFDACLWNEMAISRCSYSIHGFFSGVSPQVLDLKAAETIAGMMDGQGMRISGSFGRDGEDSRTVTECHC